MEKSTKYQKKHGGKYSTRARKLGVIGLTLMQRNFIDEFMLDHNAAAAARRAGYAESKCKETGSRLRNNPAIRAELERREYDRAERCDIKTDHILRELKAIAYFDVRSLFDPVTKQFRADPWSFDEQELRGLVNFEIVILDPSGTYIAKAVPGAKLRALELLARHKGLLNDRVESTTPQKVTFSTDFGEGALAMDEP